EARTLSLRLPRAAATSGRRDIDRPLPTVPRRALDRRVRGLRASVRPGAARFRGRRRVHSAICRTAAKPVLRRGMASRRAPRAGRCGARPLTPELLPEGVEAALGLRRPHPTAGAVVARVMAWAGARLAADAGVALREERMDGDVVRSQVGPS